MIMSIISDIRAYTAGMNAELTFGEWLEDQLQTSGYTQTDLAEELGVAQSTISNWVNDVSPPTRANCYKLANIFRVPRREVVLRAGHKPRQQDLLPQDLGAVSNATSESTSQGSAVEPGAITREVMASLRDPRVRLFLRRAGELSDEQWDELLGVLEEEEEG